MQSLYINDPVAARRRVKVWLVDATDGITREAGETGGQPTFSINGAAPANTAGVLVAVDAAKGLYYVELSQANIAALRPGDSLSVIYKSAATAVFDETVAVLVPDWVWEGTLSAGAASSFTLPNIDGASAVDSFYNDMVIWPYAGTGAGQPREVATYTGATRVGSPRTNFVTALDTTTRVMILPTPPATALTSFGGAVWDELRASHVTASTFGEGVALTAAERTSVGTAVWATTTRTLTSAVAIAADIAAAVWNALVASYNATVGSFGKRISDQMVSKTEAAAAVWDEAMAGHLAVGSTGEKLNSAAAAGNPWAENLPGTHPVGTAGHIIGTRLDVLISSRAAIVDWSAVRAGKIDFLDVSILSRLAAAGYSAPPSVAAIAGAVWDEAMANHLAALSTGAKLNAAGSSADPWSATTRTLTSLAAQGTEIENAVWNASKLLHTAQDTTGGAILGKNRWSISGATVTILAANGTTQLGTLAFTEDANGAWIAVVVTS